MTSSATPQTGAHVFASLREDAQQCEMPVWDAHALDELRAIGGDELVKTVVRQSLKDAEDRIAELRQLSPEQPLSSWHESVHGLHGVVVSLGAVRLSQIVAEALDLEKFDRAQSYAVEFTQQLSEVRDILAVFLT